MFVFRRTSKSQPAEGEYVVKTRAKGNTAIVGCPRCGGAIPLNRHIIGNSGLVNPRIRCPYQVFGPCGWQSDSTLDRWER